MKLAVFDDYRIGVVMGDDPATALLHDVTAVLPDWLAALPVQRMNWLIAHWAALQPALAARAATVAPQPVRAVRLLPPSPQPLHVFAAPANYRKHVGELGVRTVSKGTAREQGFFLKAPGSLVGASGAIELPRGSRRRFDHECELAVIIGQGGRNVPRASALAHVFGYTCLIDATMRIEPGVGDEERSMRKSFAGFTPTGPWLVTADTVVDPQNLRSRLWVDEVLKQDGNTRDMIVGVAEMIELISSVLPLTAGDVIAMGTPEGVSPLAAGSTVRIAIDGIGQMQLPVVETAMVAPRAW